MWQILVHHKQFPVRLSCCYLYLLFELSDDALLIVATVVVLFCSILGFYCSFWKRVPHISVNLNHASDGLALAIIIVALLQLTADLMTRNCRRFLKECTPLIEGLLYFVCVHAGFNAKLSKIDRGLMCWFAFSGLTHMILEGYFVFTPDFFTLKAPHLLAEVCKSICFDLWKHSATVYTKHVFYCGLAKIMDVETSESSSSPRAQPSMYTLVQML